MGNFVADTIPPLSSFDCFGQIGQPDEFRHAIEGPKAGTIGDESTSRKGMSWVDHRYFSSMEANGI